MIALIDAVDQDIADAETESCSKCLCGITHDPSPDGLPPLSPEAVVGAELGDTLWLPGHISSRDRRRRVLSRSEWCDDYNFMGVIKAARSHRFVWMKRDTSHRAEYEWRECPGWLPHPVAHNPIFALCDGPDTCPEQHVVCDHLASGCTPWTRIEMPVGCEYER